MILAARNWLSEAGAVAIAHGGADAGTNITALAAMQSVYSGYPFVSTKGGSTTNRAYLTWTFPATRPFRVMAVLRHNLPLGAELYFELRTGGAAGTIQHQQTEVVGYSFNSLPRHTVILLSSRKLGDYVKIEWRSGVANRQFQAIRFWGSDALMVKPKSYKIRYDDSSKSERSDAGQIKFMEGFRRRTLDFTLGNENRSAIVLPIDNALNLDGLSQLTARAGRMQEVLVSFKDSGSYLSQAMTIHGRISALGRVGHQHGPKYSRRLAIREYA